MERAGPYQKMELGKPCLYVIYKELMTYYNTKLFMKLVPFTTLLITCTTLVNRYYSKLYDYNVNTFILLVEIVKCCVVIIILKYYYHQKVILPLDGIETNYCIVGLLYFIANTLLFKILQLISAGSFIILSQHRILWVVLMSMVVLKKKFNNIQLVACILNLMGVLMVFLNTTKDALYDTNMMITVMILLHGAVSSLASVYIEKTMKIDGKQNIQSYCNESLKLYIAGIPVYIIGAIFHNNGTVLSLPPLIPFLVMVSLTALQGMSIGAIFKFHGAMIRTFIQSSAIVLIIIFSHFLVDPDEELTNVFWSAVILVMVSLLMFKGNGKFKIYHGILLAMSLFIYIIHIDMVSVSVPWFDNDCIISEILHVARKRENAPPWIKNLCPGAMDFFDKVEYFGNMELGTTNTFQTSEFARRSVCQAKLANVITDELGTELFIYAGSHLGAIRHGAPIPWDDDVDIAIDVKYREKFMHLCNNYDISKYDDSATLHCDSFRDSGKLYVVDKEYYSEVVQSTMKNAKWPSPSLDIFFVDFSDHDNTKEINTFNKVITVKGRTSQHFFPTRKYFFGGEIFLGPSEEYSYNRYDPSVCKSQGWNHRLKKGVKSQKFGCCDMASRFPFIKHYTFYNIFVERVVLGSQVLNEYIRDGSLK